jgi:hypothetical protein
VTHIGSCDSTLQFYWPPPAELPLHQIQEIPLTARQVVASYYSNTQKHKVKKCGPVGRPATLHVSPTTGNHNQQLIKKYPFKAQW